MGVYAAAPAAVWQTQPVRAAVLQQPNEPLAVAEVDDPEPRPDELVLHVDACGVCGSDLHLSDAFPLPGLVMGHEFCGTVLDAGPATSGFAAGDRVTALSLRTCGTCAGCLTGRPPKCANVEMIGFQRPGAFAERVAVGAGDCFKLPDALTAQHGAMIEPLAVGLHTVDRAGIEPGDDVLVLGAGPVGAAVALWLRHAGAGEIVVSDPVDHRRALAEEVGATATIDPAAADVRSAFESITGAPPRLVIECVGVPGLLQHCFDVIDVDGRVVVAGVCMTPDQVLPVNAVTKELDVRFSFYYRTRDYKHTIAMIDHERIDPLPLVTGEVTLDELPDRFQALKSPTVDCKVLVTPNPGHR
ncbi:MAG: alcohol dehydrogenase catalytic domain-containing protein [Actinobacteria bacterium]|nr:alcohol dehydrogenase catalytic domain-containing protein [Actinomycetota bacterium]